MGTSPSILTEALWFLEKQKRRAIHQVICVGTQASQAEAEAQIFARGGAMGRLRKFLGKPPEWLTPGNGFNWETEPTKDSRDLAQAKAMDKRFRKAVLEAQKESEALGEGEVIACISGGRKTMSSSLHQAMMLLARPQDWAFHVLLNLPEKLDERVVTKLDKDGNSFGFPGDPKFPDLAKVGVDGFELALVRLRRFALSYGLDLNKSGLIDGIQTSVDEASILPELTIDLSNLYAQVNRGSKKSIPIKLSPQSMVLLAAWCIKNAPMRRRDSGPSFGEVMNIYESSAEKVPFKEDEMWETIEKWVRDKDGSQYFDPIKSRLTKELKEIEPGCDIFSLNSIKPKPLTEIIKSGIIETKEEMDNRKKPYLIGFNEIVYSNNLIHLGKVNPPR